MAKEKEGSSSGEEAAEQAEIQELDQVQSLRKALEEEKEKAEKYLANWQRAEADFINYKKRNEQERSEVVRFANASLMTDLLPVLDDLERALGNVPDELDGVAWIDGVGHIYRKLKAALEDRGLSQIEAEGEEFDPNVHEAVACVEGDEGKVCGELQKGYRLRDRLLRPSKVMVGKEGEGSESVEDR